MAGQTISTMPDVFDDAIYSLPSDPAKPRQAKTIGVFRIDNYEYPPPFLLLPRALGLVAPDFLRLRMLWYGLTAGVLLAAMLAVARMLGPAAGTRAILLAPLVWCGIPMLNALQKGNVQVLVIAISMLAMVLFARGRDAAGGALLGYASVGKIYPGMLVLYLILRRQWRAVAWTASFALLYVLLSIADTGVAPIRAFVEQFPKIVGGEAFAAFRNPVGHGHQRLDPGPRLQGEAAGRARDDLRRLEAARAGSSRWSWWPRSRWPRAARSATRRRRRSGWPS